jgi:hypothetical protein
MPKIPQHAAARPRHVPPAVPHPAELARAAPVARGGTNGPPGLPPPLANRPAPMAGATLAPRAALPPRAAGSPALRGLPGSPGHRGVVAQAPGGGVKLEQLPPVPRIRDPRGGWNQMWKSAARQEMFDPLRRQYQKHLDQDVPGPKFLQKLVDLTGAPGTRAFTTARADVTLFIARLPGVEEPVRLLRRDADDGTLGDLVRLQTGSDEEIAQALEGIGRRERVGIGRRHRYDVQKAETAAAADPAGAAAPEERGSLPELPAPYFFKNKVKSKACKRICEPLLDRYVAASGKPTTLAGFMELVFQGTASAPRLPTERPDISHFLVQLPGFEEPLHVLRRETHDGKLAGINIAESGDPDAVAREVAAMSQTARQLAGRGRVNEDRADARPRPTLPKDLHDVYDAFRARPENVNLADTTFHVNLCEWAEQATGTARKTRFEGIERFTVDVPHYGQVELLGQRDEKGRVVSVQRLKSEAELEDKLQRMGRLAKMSRGGMTAKRTGEVTRVRSDDIKRRLNLWKTMKSPLQGEFQAWKKQHVGQMSGAGSFVAHLEKLCAAAGETVVADGEKTVTRHRITPNPGGPSFTVLRYANAAGVATGMRVIDATLTEQQAIAAMATFEKRSQTSRLALKPTAAPRVVADDIARPAAKEVTSAKAMRRALEGMLANRRAGKTDLLAGLADEDELRTWFSHDGSPAPGRTAGSFVHLQGFNRARGAVVSLLTQLGQQDLVNAMPTPMSAELMARILKARVEHPEAGNDELMQMVGVSSDTYHDYLNLSTGELRSATRLRNLPGYEAHWTEIRDALYQLGHAEHAAQLRGPVSDPAERLVYGIEDEMYALQKALHAMREDGLTRRQAARRAGLSNPALLRTLADKQGKVRNLQFIASRLPGDVSPEMTSRLGEAVRRLTDLAERDMAVRPLNGRSRKLFVVGITAARMKGGAEARRLRDLYADNTDLIRKPRSFENERPRQTLRWLATALKRWFPEGVEIQAYYDPVKGEIWASSNVDEVNERLREFLSSGGLVDKLAAYDEGPGHASRMDRDRTHRQMCKLKRTLDDPSLQPDEEARAVLEAMAAGRFRVPPPHEHPDEGGRRVNLHAERRIRDQVRAETGHVPDAAYLCGTRRPCGICAKDLDLDASARRGPIWTSASSRAGHDPDAVADEYAEKGIPTFISQARDGRWTAGQDTDSEAEPALEGPAAKRKAPAAPKAPPPKRRATEDVAGGKPIAPTRSGQPVAARQAIDAQQEIQIEALQEDALDAATLLGRQVDFPVPREQIAPLLQGLLDEGRRRFDDFRAQLAADPEAQATPEQRQAMREIGELSLRIRRSVSELGWLPAQALPTAALPAGVQPPADGDWERPMRALFTPGTASGARNICWFDTLAQLALDESRDLMGDMQPVDALAAELRATADRLGLTEAGAMADDDHGALQLIAHALGVQVHVFLRQPDGQLALSPLQSVGAPDGDPVFVYSDDTHFEPLWPAWAQERPGNTATKPSSSSAAAS